MSKTVRERYASSVIWQVISFMFGSLGFIIYTPYLAASKSQYGIYSVVTGLTLYAGLFDFGFGRVGTRVGAELVGCGELEKATRVIAYSGFLSFISALVVSILVLIIAFYPDTLLSGLALSQDRSLAFGMLVLLAVSLPVNAWNNIMVACYSVRMEESIVFRFVALGNFLKLIFFVLFFMNHESNPLAYYMMIQCFNFFITLFVSVIAFRRYRLFNLSFHRHFRFSFDFFLEHRKFAFGFYAGSVIVLLALYSEMPLISRLLGVHAAGDYAI
ncbi:MAG: hypothetical protein FJX95_09325, partial [Bacteroidetes bacterium]|nr:hypothetical protein [Bacteroidota bacterium]